jgi:hypothetical protein
MGQLKRVAKKKGEVVTLYCERCTWSSELPLAQTEHSVVVPCSHCAEPLYWHRCEGCGLCYAGGSKPKCSICDDDSLDDITFD